MIKIHTIIKINTKNDFAYTVHYDRMFQNKGFWSRLFFGKTCKVSGSYTHKFDTHDEAEEFIKRQRNIDQINEDMAS